MQLFVVKRHRKKHEWDYKSGGKWEKRGFGRQFFAFFFGESEIISNFAARFIVTFCGDNAYLACEGQFYKVKIDGNFFCACEGRNK